MQPFIWKGFDILHQHIFNYVYFSAWKGNYKVNNRSVKKFRLLIDWKRPLTQKELHWLTIKEEV